MACHSRSAPCLGVSAARPRPGRRQCRACGQIGALRAGTCTLDATVLRLRCANFTRLLSTWCGSQEVHGAIGERKPQPHEYDEERSHIVLASCVASEPRAATGPRKQREPYPWRVLDLPRSLVPPSTVRQYDLLRPLPRRPYREEDSSGHTGAPRCGGGWRNSPPAPFGFQTKGEVPAECSGGWLAQGRLVAIPRV